MGYNYKLKRYGEDLLFCVFAYSFTLWVGGGGSNQHRVCYGSMQPLSYTPVLGAGDLFAAPDCLPDIFIRTIRTRVKGLRGCVFLSGSKSSEIEEQ